MRAFQQYLAIPSGPVVVEILAFSHLGGVWDWLVDILGSKACPASPCRALTTIYPCNTLLPYFVHLASHCGDISNYLPCFSSAFCLFWVPSPIPLPQDCFSCHSPFLFVNSLPSLGLGTTAAVSQWEPCQWVPCDCRVFVPRVMWVCAFLVDCWVLWKI